MARRGRREVRLNRGALPASPWALIAWIALQRWPVAVRAIIIVLVLIVAIGIVVAVDSHRVQEIATLLR